MLSSQEVQHIAKLARLKLTAQEEEKFRGELSSILDYVSQLQKVNTKKVEPTSQVTGLENVMQADEILEPQTQQELIDQAPQKEGRQIKVRAVFE